MGDADALALAEGQGVAEALATAVPDADADGDGEGVGVALGLALAERLAEGETLAVAWAQIPLGIGVGASRVWLPPVLALPPPSRSSAAGTTSKPRMTVMTKASAPHSWSQKARDELRIRARRPVRAEAYCAC